MQAWSPMGEPIRGFGILCAAVHLWAFPLGWAALAIARQIGSPVGDQACIVPRLLDLLLLKLPHPELKHQMLTAYL